MRGVVGFVVCLGLLVACSDDSDPLDPGPDPIDFDVGGTWSYEAAELTGNGATCTIDDATMELSQGDDGTITGTAEGHLDCDVDGQDFAWDRVADVENGSLDGNDLTFVFSDLNSQAERAEVTHEGTIDGDGDTMSGTARLNYENFELTGEWTATRD